MCVGALRYTLAYTRVSSIGGVLQDPRVVATLAEQLIEVERSVVDLEVVHARREGRLGDGLEVREARLLCLRHLVQVALLVLQVEVRDADLFVLLLHLWVWHADEPLAVRDAAVEGGLHGGLAVRGHGVAELTERARDPQLAVAFRGQLRLERAAQADDHVAGLLHNRAEVLQSVALYEHRRVDRLEARGLAVHLAAASLLGRSSCVSCAPGDNAEVSRR